jgi:hypothetical protein
VEQHLQQAKAKAANIMAVSDAYTAQAAARLKRTQQAAEQSQQALQATAATVQKLREVRVTVAASRANIGQSRHACVVGVYDILQDLCTDMCACVNTYV